MALRLIRRAPTTLFSPLFRSPIHHPSPILNSFSPQSRRYVSEMRKSAFEDRLRRLIRNDVQLELHRHPPTQLVPSFKSFAIDERPGEQWIRLRKEFGGNEEIKVEVTLFGSAPAPKKDGGIVTHDDLELYISMVIGIFKDERSGILEFMCNVWPDSIEIENVFIRNQDAMAGRPYLGPPFKDLDDELQTSLYDFLEVRGINDELALFLHKCMHHKSKNEYIRWMGKVESFVAQKR